MITGGAGGYLENASGEAQVRPSGRLKIDPGVLVKLQNSRIELGRGPAQLIAEGHETKPITFTSLNDHRYGAGGGFNTNGNQADLKDTYDFTAVNPLVAQTTNTETEAKHIANAGEWGGIVLNSGSSASIDHSYIAFAGGTTPIEGEFDSFNPIEVHEASLRLANSRLEFNDSGDASTDRNARGSNIGATVFVRSAEPILVRNDFRNNAGATISINANSLTATEQRDAGRQTGAISRYLSYDGNVGPLIADNTLTYKHGALASNLPAPGLSDPKTAIAGLVIRGQEITVESVWDDTDITHILTDTNPNTTGDDHDNSEIVVRNLHTATGLQLRSRPDESLVIKFEGDAAGLTATGTQFDIDDRIGGTVQIIGQPGFPVVMTSLFDSEVGAGVDVDGQGVLETVNSANKSAGSGDWRGLQFLPLSNDRNVSVFVEPELLNISGAANSINSTVEDATNLGVLAPNFATPTQTVVNTSESAQEKSGDDNRRLGFEVHGSIAYDSPGDVDVYAFDGYAGSEVWIDIDKTSSSLDLMLELLDASGEVLARSIDSQLDQENYGTILGLAQGLEREAFRGGDFYTRNSRDPGFRVILPGASGEDKTRYFIRVRSQPGATTITTLGDQEDSLAPEVPEEVPTGGQTSGLYELRVRLRQRDEKPGSTVRYADIRYPTNGIRAVGLPSHSPLTGENGESAAPNDDFDQAQRLGNLLASDRNTISVAGDISELTDIDWYTFTLDYITEQEPQFAWSTIFDIDYADGIRGDLSLAVFDAAGQLLYVGHDSDIADDQSGLEQENDFDDLSRGSLGKLDPFIGSTFLPAGTEQDSFQYYVAVINNEHSPLTLDQFRQSDATLPLARLEPVSSVNRIVEDHIGSTGYESFNEQQVSSRGIINTNNALSLGAHVRGFTLADMTAFLTTPGGLRTFNPLTGELDSTPRSNRYSYPTNVGSAGDLDMLTDGTLVAYISDQNNTGHVGTVYEIEPGFEVDNDGDRVPTPNTGGGADRLRISSRYSDGIDEDTNQVGTTAPPANDVWSIDSSNVDALVIGRSGYNGGSNTVEYLPQPLNDNQGGSADSAVFYSVRDNENTGGGTHSVIYGANSQGNASSNISTGPNTHDYGRMGWVPGGNGPQEIGDPGDNVPVIGQDPQTGDDIHMSINGFTTGLQFRNEVRAANQLYAVSERGQFFRITPRDSDLSRANDNNTEPGVDGDHDQQVEISDARDFEGILRGVQGNNNPQFATRTLQGLAAGPVNLEGGRYQGMFFAITNFGELICIDPDGGETVDGDPDAKIVDNVFDTDGDGVADSWISNTNLNAAGTNPLISNVRGFAFSQLDMNLWHPTQLREADSGHGVYGVGRQTDDAMQDSDGIASIGASAPDITREETETNANTSMFFGLEGDDISVNARWQNFEAGSQYGVQSQNGNGAGTYPWQLDLAAGALEGSSLDANYNIAGGAHGSLITDSFSLAGYAGTDKPTLYFTYFLDTEGQDASDQDTNNSDNAMRDSARAFASRDGGVTWELIATNNSVRSGLLGNTPHAELAPNYTYSSQIGDSVENENSERNQRVQELFDSSGSWRQARVDLADFAGESSIMLRFDFSTGGDLDRGAVNNATITPEAIRTVMESVLVPEANGNVRVKIDNMAGISVGMQAMQRSQQSIVAGGVPLESVAEVVAIELVPDPLNPGLFIPTVELEHSVGSGVTYQRLDADGNLNEIAFFTANINKDLIPSIAGQLGAFDDPEVRSAHNDFEGFYIDDIIVGFAERGEMVVNSSEYNDGDADTPESNEGLAIADQFGIQNYPLQANGSDYQQKVLDGEYQLEIRRGTEYGQRAGRSTSPSNVEIISPFDTNDRHILNPAEAAVELHRNDLQTLSAELQLFGTAGNGGNSTAHSALVWGVDLQDAVDADGQISAFLEFDYAVNHTSERLEQLPSSFTGQTVASGDGVAVSRDDGAIWRTVGNLTYSEGATQSLQIDLSAVAAYRVNGDVGDFLGAVPIGENVVVLNETVGIQIGMPVTGGSGTSIPAGTEVAAIFADGVVLLSEPVVLPNNATLSIGALSATTLIGFHRTGTAGEGGIAYGNAVIRTAPEIETTELVGDRNIIREQGQFVIENNFISHAEEYGIRIDAARDAVTDAPSSGVARNLPVLNTDRLVPGVVVVNNIFVDNDEAGILFSGDPNTGNGPTATVPFGRIMNNSFFGNNAQNGIEVTENAGPTILNNVFSSLAQGINVDETSTASTIIATSAFYNIGSDLVSDDPAFQTNGQQFEIALTNDPFVDAQNDNFYPTTGSPIIDSSLGSLQDRPAIQVVTEPVGISESPLLAPEKDIYGQLRADDPAQGNATGLGSNVFKDRGAVERVDEIGPTATLIGPLDGAQNPPVDLSAEVDTVRVVGADAEQIFEFVIQLSDIGAGVDKETVHPDAVTVKRRDLSTPFASEVYDEILTEGTDYVYLYSKNTNQITLKSTSVYPLGDYLVELAPSITTLIDPITQVETVTRRFTDLAGNLLQSNTIVNDDRVSFLIKLENLPMAPGQLAGSLVWPDPVHVVNGQESPRVKLQWQQPGAATNPLIEDYEVQKWEVGDYQPDGTGQLVENWVVVSRADMELAPTDKIPVTDPEVTVGELILGKSYQFRVAAKSNLIVGTNSVGDFSDVTAAILITRKPSAPSIPTFGVEPGQLNLEWAAPLYMGGEIISYDVQVAVKRGDGTYGPFINATDDDLDIMDLDAVISGQIVGSTAEDAKNGIITNGTYYKVQVRASNNYGKSDWAQSPFERTPRQKAEAVSLSGEVADKSISVWWDSIIGVDDTDLNGGNFVEYEIEVEWATGTVTVANSVVDRNVIEVDAVDNVSDGMTVVGAGIPTGTKVIDIDIDSNLKTLTLSRNVNVSTSDLLTVSNLVQLPSMTSNPTEFARLSVTQLDVGYGPELLVNGVAYTVRVFVETDGGRGLPAEEVLVPVSAPSAPTGLNLQRAGDQTLKFVWAAGDSGGSTGISYQAELNNVVQQDTITALEWDANNLINGLRYYGRVRAVAVINNVPVYSDWSEYADEIPLDTADAPAPFSAVPQDGGVDLSWGAPSDLGGSPIRGYELAYTVNGNPKTINLPSFTSTYSVSSLQNGVDYTFILKARTDAGTGDPAFVTATPSASPGQPTEITVTGSPGELEVSWTAPAETGGANITIARYIVEHKPSNASDSEWSRSGETNNGDEREMLISNLNQQTSYVVRVAAVNSANKQGEWSDNSNAIIPGDLSTAPIFDLNNNPVTIGNRFLEYSWQQPSDSKGHTISGYRYKIKPRDSQENMDDLPMRSVSGTSIRVTQLADGTLLENGVAYEFRVAAFTAVGIGEEATLEGDLSHTPGTIPAAPTGLTGSARSRQANLEWQAPANTGGINLEGYTVQYRKKDIETNWSEIDVTSNSAVIPNLVNQTVYEFQVAARNAAGTGLYGSTLELQIGDVPGAPSNLRALTTSDGKVTVAWHHAQHPEDGSILTYEVDYQLASDDPNDPDPGPGVTTSWKTGAVVSYPWIYTKLNRNLFVVSVSYRIRVRAVAQTGSGAPAYYVGTVR